MLRSTSSVILRFNRSRSIFANTNYQHIIQSQFHMKQNPSPAVTTWVGKLFNLPKGFGKFERPGKSTPSATIPSSEGTPNKENNGGTSKDQSQSPKEEKASNQQSKSGSTASNANGDKTKSSGTKTNHGAEIPDPKFPVVALAATVTLILMLLNDLTTETGREITWQEFQSHLLETGNVERIIVSNKNIARVIMRAVTKPIDADGSDKSSLGEGRDTMMRGSDGHFEKSSDPFDHSGDSSLRTSTDPTASPADKFKRYPRIGVPSQASTSRYHFAIGTVDSFERKLEDAQKALHISPRDYVPVLYVDETDWLNYAIKSVPNLLLIGATLWFMKKASSGLMNSSGGPGGIFNMSKSASKKIKKETVTTTYADVAGCDEAKREIMEFVEFLKDPKKFTALGAKIPKGALLSGPPGTGKTLLARATAGEANVPFYSASGSDFVEMFVGVGASRVRDLFKEARANAPSIIFIDEIDAIGRKRGSSKMGGNDERENTLNQLLVEMDGFDNNSNVIVLAGTNRADVLDDALKRPGRFDRQVVVEKPDIGARQAIFNIHLKKIILDGNQDDFAARLASLTPGFVGADIANICNEAAIIAARKNKTAVGMVDFENATDRVIGGLESKKIISPEEKKVIAYHEAGHAVAGWFLEHADPLLKVTVVPRSSGALGFAQYLPKEVSLRNRDQILDIVCMALAGRASEEVNFGKVTTGASDDLKRVTSIAYSMVQVYGMSEKIGQVSFQPEGQERLYGEATAEIMDLEVKNLVTEAYKRTVALITEKKSQVIMVAELLMEKETITNKDVARLIGKRPFSSGKDYENFVDGNWEDKKTESAGEATNANVDTESKPEVPIPGVETLTPAI